MTFLIRTIDHTASGREIVRERIIDQDALTIGRATKNDIHLPDLAVEQEHVRIAPATGGQLAIEAVGTRDFRIDGQSTRKAIVDPRVGVELALGSALLVIGEDDDGKLAVTIRQAEGEPKGSDSQKGFALAAALPSKRAMSWTLLGVILLGFLAVPVVSSLTRDKGREENARTDDVAWDAAWSTGDLSLAHHALEDSCESCHVEPFVSVRDSTCLSCHEDIGDHAPSPRMASGRAPASFGDGLQRAVAESFGKEGPGSCTTCHTEHEGPSRMEPARQEFCADCHDRLDTRLTDTALGNASDFGKAHPEFKAAIFTELKQEKPRRVSLDTAPREMSGLKFPHDIHLDPQGGPARMAIKLGARAGYGEALTCQSCHRPTDSGASFAPIEMEQDCEACHSLVYDRVGSTFRTLRHGDVEQMRADLIAMDRAPRRPVVSGRSRPGQFRRGGIYYQNFGPPAASLVGVDGALSPGGVCGECHLPDRSQGRLDIMPVRLPDRFFLNGGFDHAQHRQETCKSCHAAGESESAQDLLMPDLASCRECHAGQNTLDADVPSSCSTCHSYHVPGGPMPADHPDREADRTIALLRRLGL